MKVRVLKGTPLASICFSLLFITLLLLSCSSSSIRTSLPPQETAITECVILIHGLGRTHRSMRQMESRLREEGYITVNLNYPSRSKTIEQIVVEHVPEALEQCRINDADKIHFVTHSMGGIIVRKTIKDNRPELLGRVVMLSPPNKGSAVVDAMKDRWYFKWFNGPAGQQLTTAPDSMPNTLGPVDYPVGIITGNDPAFFDSLFITFIPEENDGKVAVTRTRLEGMSDFLVVPESHTYIMYSGLVQDETIHFLRYGTFSAVSD
jgi:pimeloyl-ACP methyl ester carboxylesterase